MPEAFNDNKIKSKRDSDGKIEPKKISRIKYIWIFGLHI